MPRHRVGVAVVEQTRVAAVTSVVELLRASPADELALR